VGRVVELMAEHLPADKWERWRHRAIDLIIVSILLAVLVSVLVVVFDRGLLR